MDYASTSTVYHRISTKASKFRRPSRISNKITSISSCLINELSVMIPSQEEKFDNVGPLGGY